MATEMHSQATLIETDGGSSPSERRTSWWTLPPDLLAESVRRVRALAWLYALAYFLAGLFPVLIIPQNRALFFSEPHLFLPEMISVTAALVVGGLLSARRIAARVKLYAGLVFEILGSFGIAAAEYHHITAPITFRDGAGGFGLSWVAPWVLLFSVVVPSRPRVALLSAGLSLAAPPLIYALGVARASNVPLGPGHFFFALVFPYFIVLIMAYVGSRVVYTLGTAVRKAREMGSYRLGERLGSGGMGEVWRAQHRMLARPAAIKLIRPEVLGARDPESRNVLVRRFEREAQATALMRSVHTLELYDFGVTDDGTFYYVMELLEGSNLAELVERFGPVPAERAVHFLRQICDSLAEAHEAGLIHRDIKPANVYACHYGREVDFIKVLDFGLVKHGGVRDEEADKLTADHVAGGTPAFMSPEQALGDKGVDGRSDLYAVGCVAYWLLTGTLVFRGRSAMETIVMHVNREAEPPSRRTELPIPAELEAIVLACLAKSPGARPQTADELTARLDSVPLAHEWTAPRAREWWKKHRPAATQSGVGS
jgi:eukaryotic-like serine/threonine-protein kinase